MLAERGTEVVAGLEPAAVAPVVVVEAAVAAVSLTAIVVALASEAVLGAGLAEAAVGQLSQVVPFAAPA